MKIKTWIKYMEGYLPTPKCRKLRYKECEDFIEVELKEVSINDVKIAFQVEDEIYFNYNKKLYTKETTNSNIDKIKNPLENLKERNENCSSYFGFNDSDTREKMIEKANNDIERYLLIDGQLYKEDSEPVYAVYCFGCGNNHASTHLAITESWRAKQRCGSYFSAFDREQAIEYTLKVAENRGDTDSLNRIKNTPKIKILDDSMVNVVTNTNN